MAEFLDMGGYAFYVWSSFGLSFFGLLTIYFMAKRYDTKQQDEIRGWIDRQKK